MSMRVLYVDDDADIREIALLALSLDPTLDVKTCASGAEGIVAASSHPTRRNDAWDGRPNDAG